MAPVILNADSSNASEFSGLRHGNFFSPVTRSDEEFLEVLMLGKGSSRIERIVSQGHSSPPDFWYDQDEWEFVAVLHGDAELEFESGSLRMMPGDWVILPAHLRHRVKYTSENPPCVWLAFFGNEESLTE